MSTVRNKSTELVTISEFASLTCATLTTVRHWIYTRRIESIRLGRRVLIPKSEFLRLVEEGRRPALQRGKVAR